MKRSLPLSIDTSSTPTPPPKKMARPLHDVYLTPTSPCEMPLSKHMNPIRPYEPLSTTQNRRDSGVDMASDCLAATQDQCLAVQTPQQLTLTPLAVAFAPSKRLLNLMNRQHLHLPNPFYDSTVQQGKMRNDIRPTLVNWCSSLSQEFQFNTETIFLSVNFLDRYLSSTKVVRIQQLYLLASSCVYLAAKFGEELKEPCISDVSALSMFGSSIKDVKRMEAKVLKELKWELTPVSPQSILSELLSSIGELFPTVLKDKITNECEVFFSLALTDMSMLRFQPAMLVFSALSLVCPNAYERLGLTSMFPPECEHAGCVPQDAWVSRIETSLRRAC
ncbi:cyclin-like protein, partial [Chytriomyces cf. hyalinus JEL632]